MTSGGHLPGSVVTRSSRTASPSFLLWLGVVVVGAAAFHFHSDIPWLSHFEEGEGLPIPLLLDTAMDWFVGVFKPLFRAVSWTLEWPVYGFRAVYLWLPWPVVMVAVGATAYRAGGWRLSGFCVLATTYILVLGFWPKAALTVALVTVALPLALSVGFCVGLLGHHLPASRKLIEPVLDFMQTIPTFAYLVPCLVLFGFGPTVGLIASATFAMPPMARAVMLGLGRVPTEVLESAVMAGATRRQQLWFVKLPVAMPTVMLGINQTILATLSMVVIAAVLGSGEDLGWQVLYTMRQAQFGESLLSGLAIVLVAMMMDRITQALSRRRPDGVIVREGRRVMARHGTLVWASAAGLLLAGLSLLVEPLRTFPDTWTVAPHEPLDAAISFIKPHYPEVTDSVRNWTLFFFMLSLRIGMDQVVSPFSWGFALDNTVTAVFLMVVAASVGLAWRYLSWQVGLAILFGGLIYYVGLTDLPWPVVLLPVTLLAWRTGGWRVGIFAFSALAFMLLSGFWLRSMISVYLCGSAVLICIVAGVSMGIVAALNDPFSALIRPVNDTLQSIPLFVFLIPVVMLFKAGEFAGLLAIIMYAIVPCIRYAELGIRQVDESVVEAARVMGSTRLQMLWRVQLPLALPEIMLGINQTVLFGLAMLVITALVCTKGLGQVIYQSLAGGGFGTGITAALCMAFIAMTADRVIQSWSARKKREYGIQAE